MLEVFHASVTERDATRCEFACLLWIQSYSDLRFDLVGFLCISFALFEKLKLKINMSQNS